MSLCRLPSDPKSLHCTVRDGTMTSGRGVAAVIAAKWYIRILTLMGQLPFHIGILWVAELSFGPKLQYFRHKILFNQIPFYVIFRIGGRYSMIKVQKCDTGFCCSIMFL